MFWELPLGLTNMNISLDVEQKGVLGCAPGGRLEGLLWLRNVNISLDVLQKYVWSSGGPRREKAFWGGLGGPPKLTTNSEGLPSSKILIFQ